MTLFDKEPPNPDILVTKVLREQQVREIGEHCYLDRFSVQNPHVIIEINRGNHYYLNTTQWFAAGDQSPGRAAFLSGLIGCLRPIGTILSFSVGYDNSNNIHAFADRIGQTKLWQPVKDEPAYHIRTFHNANSAIQIFFSANRFF